MKKINILFLIDTIHGMGGTENHLAQRVTHLDRDRFSSTVVSFFCGQNADSFIRRIEGRDVQFVGHTDRVRDYISVMDVACLTSVRNEGLSNAVLEEMAMAKPVVATTVGGSPEMIVDGESEFSIPAMIKKTERIYLDLLDRRAE